MDFEQVAHELEIDEATYVSLLKRFCELTQDDLNVLDRSLGAPDFTGVHSAAHSVKGASASLSLWNIYEAASTICETAKAGSTESITELSASIRSEVASLLGQMAESDRAGGDHA